MVLQASREKPLIEYSLDRSGGGAGGSNNGGRQHTYSCEQNAQILLRLQRKRQLKKVMAASTGKLVMSHIYLLSPSSIPVNPPVDIRKKEIK